MAQFLDMSERVIVVTGGAQGIGWGIVCTFLIEGGTVLCVDLVKPDEKAADLGSYRDRHTMLTWTSIGACRGVFQ